MNNAVSVAEQLTTTASDGSTVIVDMSATTFCDCAGAHAIVRTRVEAARGQTPYGR